MLFSAFYRTSVHGDQLEPKSEIVPAAEQLINSEVLILGKPIDCQRASQLINMKPNMDPKSQSCLEAAGFASEFDSPVGVP